MTNRPRSRARQAGASHLIGGICAPCHRGRGNALLPSIPKPPVEGGGGCLMSATAQPWQVQDGRCRPERLASEGRQRQGAGTVSGAPMDF
jgi:hypothetical protein